MASKTPTRWHCPRRRRRQRLFWATLTAEFFHKPTYPVVGSDLFHRLQVSFADVNLTYLRWPCCSKKAQKALSGSHTCFSRSVLLLMKLLDAIWAQGVHNSSIHLSFFISKVYYGWTSQCLFYFYFQKAVQMNVCTILMATNVSHHSFGLQSF